MLPLQIPLVVGLLAGMPVARPPGVDVRWEAPPECPDRAALLAAIERRLGRPLVAGDARVDARVTGDARRGYTLRLTLSVGPRDEAREIADLSCAHLADAAALRVVGAIASTSPVIPAPPVSGGESEAVAVAPAPVQASGPKELAPTDAPAAPPVQPALTAARPPTPASEKDVQEDRYKGPGAVLRLHGGGEVGGLPGPTGGIGLAVGLLWPRLRVELQGVVLAPRVATLAAGTVRAGLLAGAVHGCGRVGRATLEVPLCLGLELGAMQGEVAGLPGARRAAGWWVAAVLGPGLAWHATRRLGVWAAVQLALAPVRPRFEQGAGDEAVPIFTPSVASGRLLVGVELRLRDRW